MIPEGFHKRFGEAVELYLQILLTTQSAPRAKHDVRYAYGDDAEEKVGAFCFSKGLTDRINGRLLVTDAGAAWSKVMMGSYMPTGKMVRVGSFDMELLS